MAKVTGAERHKARLRRIRGPAMRREVGKAVYAASDLLATEAAISITTGAVSGANHVVSAPGGPPNADTHDLDRSIKTEKTGDLTAIAYADSGHAVPVEFGTTKMEARPYMGPAANKIRPDAQRLVDAAKRRVITGGTL